MKEKELIFGIRAVIEAIEAGKEIDRIVIKRELQGDLAKELMSILKNRKDIFVQRVPVERLDKYTRKNHQGVIALLSAITYQHIDDIVPTLFEDGKTPLIMVLDGITDVRNFGAIARTCEVAGVDAIVIPARGSVSVNADAVKTSAGALLRIPVCKEENLNSILRYLRDSGINLVAATEKAVDTYTSANMERPTAIIMGAEDLGISPDNLRIADTLVKIPQVGSIASLNVSVAAGILIYEALRQRGIK